LVSPNTFITVHLKVWKGIHFPRISMNSRGMDCFNHQELLCVAWDNCFHFGRKDAFLVKTKRERKQRQTPLQEKEQLQDWRRELSTRVGDHIRDLRSIRPPISLSDHCDYWTHTSHGNPSDRSKTVQHRNTDIHFTCMNSPQMKSSNNQTQNTHHRL
jgi:hypothetical protein